MNGTPALVRRLRWIGIALVVVVIYGTAGYMLLERWSFLDSLFMTITTMTTVGFREVRPLDQSGRIFTLSVIVLGVGVALLGVSMAAAVLAEAEIGGRARRRRMQRRIELLQDHFIVCAYGRVGRAACRELAASGNPYIVVDPKEELRERMEEDDVLYLIDDPSNEPVLREAGVERARALLCAVDDDATNVYIALTARAINPGLFIVARASERGSTEKLERAGADRVVSPYVTSGHHMVRMAQDPSVVNPLEDTARSIRVEEHLVGEESPLCARQVGELHGVLAIRRSDGTLLASPNPDLRLEAGDVVLMLEGSTG